MDEEKIIIVRSDLGAMATDGDINEQAPSQMGKLPFCILGHNSPASYRKAARHLAEDFANSTGFSPAPYEANELDLYPE